MMYLNRSFVLLIMLNLCIQQCQGQDADEDLKASPIGQDAPSGTSLSPTSSVFKLLSQALFPTIDSRDGEKPFDHSSIVCIDSDQDFFIAELDDGNKRNCIWVSAETSRCSYPEAKQYCPHTCGDCSSERKLGKSDKSKGKTTPRPSPRPSPKPSPRPTSSPSDDPSSKPSADPTSNPSSNPSDAPTQCEDEPNWKYTQPSKAIASPFVDKTCSELEAMVKPEGYEKLCNNLVYDSFDRDTKCILEACCFCGGGVLTPTPCNDLDNFQLLGNGWGCEEISQFAVDPSSDFCNMIDSFTGLTAKEACCVCGGGEHGSHYFTPSNPGPSTTKRTLAEDSVIYHEYKFDITKQEAGESPGIPNLEFLGIGYDIIRANPRGSSTSELDPGYRYRVLALLQDQSTGNLTIDQAYTVPLGTEFRYTSSCRYDSSSTEISSEKDYQQQLSGESSFSNSLQASGQFSYAGWFANKLNVGVAWSESEKYSQFTSKSIAENLVSFEARAICSEYEVSFKPNGDKILDKDFKESVTNLPVPFQKDNPTHIAIYKKFINIYGTHYISKVVLGAKRIMTTSMSALDVADLTKDSVDITSTLSVDVQLALGTPDYVKDSLGGVFKEDPKEADTIVYVIDQRTGSNQPPTPPTPPTGFSDGGFTGSNKFDKFTSTSRQSESASKISQKKTTTTEVNVGGYPKSDWREWAETAKERPMPIMVEYDGLWELMSRQKAEAFIDALYYIEGIGFDDEDDEDPYLELSHFGVATGFGNALSESSIDPNASYRALLQRKHVEMKATQDVYGNDDLKKGVEVEKNECKGVDNLEKWRGYVKGKDGQYLCGARVQWYDHISDAEGVTNVELTFCYYGLWNEQLIKNMIPAISDGVPGGDWFPPNEVKCDTNHFVYDIAVGHHPDLGIDSLSLKCCNPSNCDDTRKEKTVYCHNSDGVCEDEIYCNPCGSMSWLVPSNLRNTTMYFISEVEGKFGKTSGNEVGVCGMRIKYDEVPIMNQIGGGALDNYITYSTTWKNRIDRPTALFATPIHGDIITNEAEESSSGFTAEIINEVVMDYDNNIMIGLADESGGAGIIAITNYGRELELERVQSFSFLALENNVNLIDEIVSGVVRYDGVVTNQYPGKTLNFNIIKKTESKYLLKLPGTFYSAFEGNPTVVIFPQWYTDAEVYPGGAYHVSVSHTFNITLNAVEINLGPKGVLDRSYLGFNFVAMSPSLKTKTSSFVYGYYTASSAGSRCHGCAFQKSEKINLPSGSVYSGSELVLVLSFDKPFKSLPSLIVSPYETEIPSFLTIPQCVVETLLLDGATIKCTEVKPSPKTIDTNGGCSFVAVGKTEDGT